MRVCISVVMLMCINLTQQCRQDVPIKLSVHSSRNLTGHWTTQVQLERDDNGNYIKVDSDHSVKKCDGSNRILITTSITGPPGPPGKGYELVPGFGYYKFYTEGKTWQDAVLTCQAEGGHLLIPNSAAEFEVVKKIWDRNPTKYQDWGKTHIFIGLSDKAKEGHWVSILGESINATGYTNWASGQPQGGAGEDCLLLNLNSQLHDGPCTVDFAYMCEIEI